MSQTWSKVRSLMRGAFTAGDAPAEPPRAAAAAAPPPSAMTPANRDAPVGDAERATEVSRADDVPTKTLIDRLDRLEAQLRQPTTLSPISVAAAPAADNRVATLGAEVADLRVAFTEFVRQHDALRGANEELSRQVSAMSELVHGLSRRVGETARDARGAQAIADETSARADASREELQEWLESRSRDIGTRLAPLYIVSLIAIIAALAAAVFSAIRLMS